jgi:phage shock protein A
MENPQGQIDTKTIIIQALSIQADAMTQTRQLTDLLSQAVQQIVQANQQIEKLTKEIETLKAKIAPIAS